MNLPISLMIPTRLSGYQHFFLFLDSNLNNKLDRGAAHYHSQVPFKIGVFLSVCTFMNCLSVHQLYYKLINLVHACTTRLLGQLCLSCFQIGVGQIHFYDCSWCFPNMMKLILYFLKVMVFTKTPISHAIQTLKRSFTKMERLQKNSPDCRIQKVTLSQRCAHQGNHQLPILTTTIQDTSAPTQTRLGKYT